MTVQDPNHWKLGVFVLFGVALVFAAFVWLGASHFSKEVFYAVAYLDESVQGLDEGAPVKFRGVTVGTVSEIAIAPDKVLVQLTMEMDLEDLRRLGLREEAPREARDNIFVNEGLRVRLAAAGITGLKYLAIDVYDPLKYPPPALDFDPPWNYVPSVRSTLKSLEASLTESLEVLPGLLEDARGTFQRVNSTLDAMDVEDLADRIRTLLDTARTKLAAIDPSAAQTTVEETTALVREIRDFVTNLDHPDGHLVPLLDRWHAAAASLEAELDAARVGDTTAALRETAGSVSDLARDARETSRELQESLLVLREALESLRALAALLERDPGALLRGRAPEPSGKD